MAPRLDPVTVTITQDEVAFPTVIARNICIAAFVEQSFQLGNILMGKSKIEVVVEAGLLPE